MTKRTSAIVKFNQMNRIGRSALGLPRPIKEKTRVLPFKNKVKNSIKNVPPYTFHDAAHGKFDDHGQ